MRKSVNPESLIQYSLEDLRVFRSRLERFYQWEGEQRKYLNGLIYGTLQGPEEEEEEIDREYEGD